MRFSWWFCGIYISTFHQGHKKRCHLKFTPPNKHDHLQFPMVALADLVHELVHHGYWQPSMWSADISPTLCPASLDLPPHSTREACETAAPLVILVVLLVMAFAYKLCLYYGKEEGAAPSAPGHQGPLGSVIREASPAGRVQ